MKRPLGCAINKKEKSQPSINKMIADLLSDPGAIQTHDLQNRNLTLYSLSYGAVLLMRGQKYKKTSHVPSDSTFFMHF